MSKRSIFAWLVIIITAGCSPSGNGQQSSMATTAATTDDAPVASAPAAAAPAKDTSQTLFTNVRVWDGSSDGLTESTNVLVVDNLIHSIGPNVSGGDDAMVIDGGGRTLMPGLIEGHGHLQMNGASLANIENDRNWEELAIRSAVNAKAALMSGFTTWRDAGGMDE